MVSKTACALCCSMLSCFGVFFLLAVALLVKTQPEYLKLGKEVTGPGPLYGSAALYATFFIVSTTVYYLENKKNGHDGIERFQTTEAAVEERKPLLRK